jgi:hypothetical protein
MAKKVIRKSDTYPLEKVEERIKHYQERELELIFKKALEPQKIITGKLLAFWYNYKTNNFKDGE